MTTNTDKLVEMARECGLLNLIDAYIDPGYSEAALAAFRAAIIADLAADVEPVAWRARRSPKGKWYLHEGPIGWWDCEGLAPASTVAALKARVAELKEAAADTLEKSPCDCPHKMRQERGEHLSGCHLFDLNAALTKGQS